MPLQRKNICKKTKNHPRYCHHLLSLVIVFHSHHDIFLCLHVKDVKERADSDDETDDSDDDAPIAPASGKSKGKQASRKAASPKKTKNKTPSFNRWTMFLRENFDAIKTRLEKEGKQCGASDVSSAASIIWKTKSKKEKDVYKAKADNLNALNAAENTKKPERKRRKKVKAPPAQEKVEVIDLADYDEKVPSQASTKRVTRRKARISEEKSKEVLPCLIDVDAFIAHHYVFLCNMCTGTRVSPLQVSDLDL